MTTPQAVLQSRPRQAQLQVSAVHRHADGVLGLDLRSVDQSPLPEWTPGAHIEVEVADGLVRHYSLCSSPADGDVWRIAVLREADAIARAELTAAGLDQTVWQCPVVLLADVRSVGVQGDGRTYGHPVVIRPVTSEDAMTADWARLPYDLLARISTRITNEVREVNRVVLDVTSKPPGTIEWE